MTELEKLEAGLPYCFTDPDIEKIKKRSFTKMSSFKCYRYFRRRKRTAQ